MTNLLKLLQTLAVLIILGLLIWFIFFRVPEGNAELKEYWEAKDFKTDSIKVEVDYSKLPKPTYRNYVPPAVVIEYKAPEINNKVSRSLNDSLITVIDSLQNQITTINALYLKLYPQAHKLIYGSFKQDTLKFDFLTTSGGILTQVYPVNYARFQYQYKDNLFSAEEHAKKPSSKSVTGALYGYAGFGLVPKAPVVGIDYYLYKGKFRLGASSFMSIESHPEFIATGTIGYKLYGR